jgi:hypothetical protein
MDGSTKEYLLQREVDFTAPLHERFRDGITHNNPTLTLAVKNLLAVKGYLYNNKFMSGIPRVRLGSV